MIDTDVVIGANRHSFGIRHSDFVIFLQDVWQRLVV